MGLKVIGAMLAKACQGFGRLFFRTTLHENVTDVVRIYLVKDIVDAESAETLVTEFDSKCKQFLGNRHCRRIDMCDVEIPNENFKDIRIDITYFCRQIACGQIVLNERRAIVIQYQSVSFDNFSLRSNNKGGVPTSTV